jgi:murein DD-endopeptidase MepM/ murein hydrolase activator NlpD
VTVRRGLALFLPLALLAFGSAGAEGPAHAPSAAATAWAVKVAPAAGAPAGTPSVSSPPNARPAAGGPFAYPADGSIVSIQSTTASAQTAVAKHASAKAESVATAVSLFKDEITADAVTARASAGTGYADAGGNVLGSGVANLRVGGQPVAPGTTKLAVGDWGQLTLGGQGVDRGAPAGAAGFRGFVTELDLHLTADHGGLPAGSEIQIGYAETAAQTAPPATATTTTTTAETTPTNVEEPSTGDSPRLRPRHGTRTKRLPLRVHPKLTAGHYVFPVYGPSSYIDTFGAARADVAYHHGDDIFGELGQPLVACTDGTVFSVGWNKVGGNRLWLLDSQGNQFYYAHLSAFTTAATNGAHVRAGQVIGFMGDTGDADGTPYHLHFEVHPVSLLYLGYDGAVDPTPYLDAWKHQQDLPFPVAAGWAPVVPGGPAAPEPGAVLLGMTDISTADGLDPGSLERALAPLKASALRRPSAPAPARRATAPSKDLGRG